MTLAQQIHSHARSVVPNHRKGVGSLSRQTLKPMVGPLPRRTPDPLVRRGVTALVMALLLAVGTTGRADDWMGGGGGYGGGGFDVGGLLDGIGQILENIPEDDGGYYEPEYYPQQPQYYPQQPQAPAVPRNAPPPRNVAPVPAARPAKNPILGLSIQPLDQNKIDKLSSDTVESSRKILKQIVDDKATKELTQQILKSLEGKLSPTEQKDLKEAIEKGRPEDVKRILEGKGLDPSFVSGVESLARVNAQLSRIIPEGALPTPAQTQELTAAFRDLQRQLDALNRQIQDLNRAINQQLQATQALINALNRQTAAINRLVNAVNQLNRNLVLINLLGRARPGQRQIPRGNGVVIVRMPGMRPGTVSPVGPGAVLAGPRMGTPISSTNSRLPFAGPSEITTGNVWKSSGIASATGQPVADSKDPIDRGLVILNRNETPVGFVLENQTFDLKPNFYQAFADLRQGTISFDRGNGQTAQYTVTAGTYEFTATDSGWELYRKTYKATIDNSGNPSVFQFVLGNQTVALQPGESKEFTSSYALTSRFDDGQGQVHEKRLFDGSYRVATSSNQGTLDLFTADAFESEPAAEEATEPSDPETRELLAAYDPAQLEVNEGQFDGGQVAAPSTSLRSDDSAELIAPLER